MFLGEALLRIMLAIGVMLLAFLGSAVGDSLDREHGPLAGALAGLGVGTALFVLALRRRNG